MGKVGWFVGVTLVLMVIGLALMSQEHEQKMKQDTGCHYEYKMKNGERVKVLDCD